MSEASTKPYLIRAIHEWCTDQGYTPYLAVAVNEHTLVPREYVRNGEIVLNVGHMATNKLKLGNDLVEFQARFNGSAREVSVPVSQISAIYARETGHGMAFEVLKPAAESGDEPRPAPAPNMPAPLLVVAHDALNDAPAGPAKEPAKEPAKQSTKEPGNTPEEPPPQGGRPRPNLTRVK